MSLAYWYALLHKKQNDLSRLQTCNGQLSGKQSEFSSNQHLMTEPELTQATWKGTLATRFDDIRIDGILASYQEIQTTQFTNVFSTLSNKMEQIRREIESIRATIARLEADDD
ncbi:hypothetical protein JOD29_002159 [Lysinibacillus composti]|uniref:DUF5082 domain-containing protein n=1 Tax=Lysinibacillus composti TaxID=720633 RepID=A0A3N9UPM0_9BACI|nr:DUF5082 family protein [Lysinibacillus composti]MBM7608893.1 hypothetical protein [Lysinibacillus composti]RQW74472.1 DUF5082 domain-containing protein [Lysinibacillus composti]